MAIYGYTKNFKLIKPQFDTDTWHDYEYRNLDTLDAVVGSIFVSGNFVGLWKNATQYTANDIVADAESSQMYVVNETHTTDPTGTFAEYMLANPTYYTLWNGVGLSRDWAIKTDGVITDGLDTDYSSKAYAISQALIDAGSSKEWANKTDGTVGNTGEYSAKKYAQDSALSAGTATSQASSASASATLASKWATQLTTPVEGGEYSAKQYAQNAGMSVVNASGSATAASNSATLARDWASKTTGMVGSGEYSAKAYAIGGEGLWENNAKYYKEHAQSFAAASSFHANDASESARRAETALDNVHGLIATPIGTIFQSIYVDESIDIARALNGQLISSTKFTGFRDWLNTVQTAIPNLFTTESNWQAEKALSKFGQCGKFVIDDDAGTIRLPAVVNAQGLLILSGIGNLVGESLPNIKGNSCLKQNDNDGSPTGAFYRASANAYVGFNSSAGCFVDFDASRSSSTYKTNAPVQQEAVQYPYYIQVATGVEETLPAIREYEINTPFFFGQSMYSDIVPDNASWLASNGQYNARAVYQDYYDWLNGKIGQVITANGGKVVLSTDTYTDYDFVINTRDSTFRLPLLNGEEDLPGATFENWTLQASGSSYSIEKNGTVFLSKNSTAVGQYIQILNGIEYPIQIASTSNHNLTVMMNFKRGQTAVVKYNADGTTNSFRFIPAVGNGTLYYYVGDTVQDASLINAGAVLGQLATKTNFVEAAAASMPSNRYIDLTLGASGSTYTAPANGWFCLLKIANDTQRITMLTKGGYFGIRSISADNSSTLLCFCPVIKGDIMTLTYNAEGTTTSFKFYYAEGEK